MASEPDYLVISRSPSIEIERTRARAAAEQAIEAKEAAEAALAEIQELLGSPSS